MRSSKLALTAPLRANQQTTTSVPLSEPAVRGTFWKWHVKLSSCYITLQLIACMLDDLCSRFLTCSSFISQVVIALFSQARLYS